MSNIPAMYDYINAATTQQSPSTIHVSNTGLARFFRRYLLQKAFSVYEWTMPATWDRDYFLYTLYYRGYLAILQTDKFGPIPQECGLAGYNVFYRPRYALVSNPLLKGLKQLEIGTQCTMIKLQPDYGGLYDLVSYYGDMLALCAESAGVNLVNSKLSFVFGAKNKAGAESLKELYDKIASGEPAAFVDKNLFQQDGKPNWELFLQNVGQNFIAPQILSAMREIENMFCTAVGIPNANKDKRERMISDEVNANSVEVSSTASLWLEQLQQSCAEASSMFGIDLSVDWRVKPQEEVVDDGRNA